MRLLQKLELSAGFIAGSVLLASIAGPGGAQQRCRWAGL